MAVKFRKVIISGLYLAQFVFRGVLLRALVFDKELRHKILARSVHISSRRILDALNVRVEKECIPNLENSNENYLIVSNHISFLDILVISSITPVNFITSVEMKNHPILGYLTRIGGSFYTERRSHHRLPEEIELITNRLKAGYNICLFPEGTSNDGLEVRQFRSSLFESVAQSGKSIVPICLKYTALDNHPLSPEDVKRIAWTNAQPFRENLMQILDLESIDVKVDIPMVIKSENINRRELCDMTHDIISKCYTDFYNKNKSLIKYK